MSMSRSDSGATLTRRAFVSTAGLATAGLAACARPAAEPEPEPTEPDPQPTEPERDMGKYKALALDTAAWKYDEANDCYYQLGLTYCLEPGSKDYESLAIFVPGAYFEGEKSGGTYKCTIKEGSTVGGFTPGTAPIVMPINAVRLAGQKCPTAYSYEGLARYLQAGFVYVYPGFRGRSGGFESGKKDMFHGGAPWPAVDLKAAIRYLRYNASVLPVDASRVFTFGYGGGGGLSALAGATGDAALYDPYLDSIGAARWDADGTDLSDATFGSASWCPVTSFDSADAAYEWMMGQWSRSGERANGEWTRLLSSDLASEYGTYVNSMDFTAGDEHLVLDAVEDGSYVAGTYYDHLMGVVEDAAATFFSTTQFPYTVTPTTLRDPQFPGDPNLAANAEVEAAADQAGDATADAPAVAGVSQVQSTVYGSAESYISSLNGDARWLTYSASRGTVSITGLWDFAYHCRPVDRGVGAFDALDRSTPANQLFGIDDESTLHFSQAMGTLITENQERYAAALSTTLAAKLEAGEPLPLVPVHDIRGQSVDDAGASSADEKDVASGSAQDAGTAAADGSDAAADGATGDSVTSEGATGEAAAGGETLTPATPEEAAAAIIANYAAEWADDLGKSDALEGTMATRVNAMNPLYFLSAASEGYGASIVAPHWRVNAGLFQSESSMTSELNLALALGAYSSVEDVAFTEVWGQGFELAERSGNAQDNLVAWVVSCCPDAQA